MNVYISGAFATTLLGLLLTSVVFAIKIYIRQAEAEGSMQIMREWMKVEHDRVNSLITQLVEITRMMAGDSARTIALRERIDKLEKLFEEKP